MKGEFKRILTVTENEQKIITKLMDILQENFALDFEETPQDLAEIMYTISMRNPKAYLYNNDINGIIEIEYQDD